MIRALIAVLVVFGWFAWSVVTDPPADGRIDGRAVVAIVVAIAAVRVLALLEAHQTRIRQVRS
jgi:hypothetical protein